MAKNALKRKIRYDNDYEEDETEVTRRNSSDGEDKYPRVTGMPFTRRLVRRIDIANHAQRKKEEDRAIPVPVVIRITKKEEKKESKSNKAKTKHSSVCIVNVKEIRGGDNDIANAPRRVEKDPLDVGDVDDDDDDDVMYYSKEYPGNFFFSERVRQEANANSKKHEEDEGYHVKDAVFGVMWCNYCTYSGYSSRVMRAHVDKHHPRQQHGGIASANTVRGARSSRTVATQTGES